MDAQNVSFFIHSFILSQPPYFYNKLPTTHLERTRSLRSLSINTTHELAAGLGLEPRIIGPEPIVIPFHYPAIGTHNVTYER